MIECILDERRLANTDSACEQLQAELSLPPCKTDSSACALSRIQMQLQQLSEPARIVVRRNADRAKRTETFDGLIAALSEASRALKILDVVIYTDDLEQDGEELASELTAEQALERLRGGNREFVGTHTNTSVISQEIVRHMFEQGQHPFATVITCADSRVAPEHIFMTGLGEIFTIRTAGNVVGEMELASAFYAADHLHTPLLVVMGHTHCGAIETAQSGVPAGIMEPLIGQVAAAIGGESDPYAASVLNVRSAMERLAASQPIAALCAQGKLRIIGAIYHTHAGEVDFLE
ncbi:MAG: carbonic anhydrase [Eggerthellaceae bacterium]|jgi:carbonic anhydrase